eukprot:7885070-Alexandrium_andersonii.AAC.1
MPRVVPVLLGEREDPLLAASLPVLHLGSFLHARQLGTGFAADGAGADLDHQGPVGVLAPLAAPRVPAPEGW